MFENKSILIKILEFFRVIIPTKYLRTLFYLNVIHKPRKIIRKSINKFYRMDHVYEVLREAKSISEERLSIIEFGVADGYSFIKILYAIRYMRVEDKVKAHGLDTFEGLPEKEGIEDETLVKGFEEWEEGTYRGRYENLKSYCKERYDNFELHKGKFEETVDEEFTKKIKNEKPILIWIDCDYYSSSKSALVPILPYIPTGCVVYFDDIDTNYGSSLTGEMKLVKEINEGHYGNKFELVLDDDLSWDSRRVYRFINLENELMYKKEYSIDGDPVRKMDDESPLP